MKINPKFQNPNGSTTLTIGIWCLVLGISPIYAQDNSRLVTLSKQIMEAKDNQQACVYLKELKDLYFQENKFNEFADFLVSLKKRKKGPESCISYYSVLNRYQHLKYLEESQNWNEYFSKGDIYRQDITASAQKVIDATTQAEPLNIYSRLLLWRFYKDQADALCEQALSDLMAASLEYAKRQADTTTIKEVADQLFSYNEKSKARQLYRLYVDKVSGSNVDADNLLKLASGFYQEGNLELAEPLYDAYIQRITQDLSSPKEAANLKPKFTATLQDIARQFAYPECSYISSVTSGSRRDSSVSGFIRDKDEGLSDPSYAEKIFSKIEELAGAEAFDEELIYLRALNLEKSREYNLAKDKYLDLVKRYPNGRHADEADFKAGMIYAYALIDTESAQAYFKKLGQKGAVTPQVISSLYQLGLLSQWEQDLEKAKTYYHGLIAKAGDKFEETVAKATARLKEIEESKPIEYNLKAFLDASWQEKGVYDMSKVEVKSSPYRAKINEAVNVTSSTFLPASGCMQVEVNYLWSGHLGAAKPTENGAGFTATYMNSGTKEINLVVVTPSGVIDRYIDMVDID